MALPLADGTLDKVSIMGFTAAPWAARSTRGSKQPQGQCFTWQQVMPYTTLIGHTSHG